MQQKKGPRNSSSWVEYLVKGASYLLEQCKQAPDETTPPGGSHDSLPIAPLDEANSAVRPVDQAEVS